jgi:hypothetical protein
MRIVVIALAAISICAGCFAAEDKTGNQPFRDVPPDHWAAPAVKQLAEQGILKGYPDSTFRGDRPITRYELAVALARFAEFIEASRKPLAPEPKKGDAGPRTGYPPWASGSIELLTSGQFLAVDSPIITDGRKAATGEDLAQALASFAARIIELDTVDPGLQDLP